MADFSLEENEEKKGIFIQRVCDLCDMRGITGDGTSGAKNIAISDCKDIFVARNSLSNMCTILGFKLELQSQEKMMSI